MIIEKVINFQADEKLKDEIFTLARPSYIDPTAVLQREFVNNDAIYLVRTDENELVAFVMTGQDNLESRKLVYIGLCCVHHEHKNNGVIKLALLESIKDSLKLQETIDYPLYCWLTTATPSIFNVFSHLFDKASLIGISIAEYEIMNGHIHLFKAI